MTQQFEFSALSMPWEGGTKQRQVAALQKYAPLSADRFDQDSTCHVTGRS